PRAYYARARPRASMLACQMRFQELRRAPLGVEARVPDRPFDEAQVSALRGDLQLDPRVGHARDASRRNARVVRGGEQQERDANPLDEASAGEIGRAHV